MHAWQMAPIFCTESDICPRGSIHEELRVPAVKRMYVQQYVHACTQTTKHKEGAILPVRWENPPLPYILEAEKLYFGNILYPLQVALSHFFFLVCFVLFFFRRRYFYNYEL